VGEHPSYLGRGHFSVPGFENERNKKKRKLPLAQPPHFGIEGAVYFVTTRTFGSRVLLPEERATVQKAILEVAKEGYTELYAYVVMPDHLHLLLRPLKVASLSKILQLIKGRSSRRLSGGKVWQKGFFDFAIVNEVKFKEKFNYIHANALKRNLARVSEEYPFSGAPAYFKKYGAVYYD
jgi:putative transposase